MKFNKFRPLRIATVFLISVILNSLGGTAYAQFDYEYDALGRLIQITETASGKQINYAYDALGNRTTVAATAGPNAPPNFVPDATLSFLAYSAGTSLPLSNDTDPDGHDLTLSITSWSSGIHPFFNAASKKLTVSGLSPGSYVVNYTISDGFGGTDTGYLNVIVQHNSCAFC